MHSKAGILATANWTEQQTQKAICLLKGSFISRDFEMWIAEHFGESPTDF